MHGHARRYEWVSGGAGLLLAATQQKLAVNIDCWLALAQKPHQPESLQAERHRDRMNGTAIEIMHTDAEGRMVLADTLTLAARAKPQLMIDFATLTGSMAVALGARYSGRARQIAPRCCSQAVLARTANR